MILVACTSTGKEKVVNVDDPHEGFNQLNKDRSEAGLSVPAHGLYLTDIEYPDEM